jgi:hypothetical protein
MLVSRTGPTHTIILTPRNAPKAYPRALKSSIFRTPLLVQCSSSKNRLPAHLPWFLVSSHGAPLLVIPLEVGHLLTMGDRHLQRSIIIIIITR